MDMITVSAKTLDEAITKALIELQTTSEHLYYEIVQKESSGFLGLFGGKPCILRARVMSEDEERAKKKAAQEALKAEKKAAQKQAEKPVEKQIEKSAEKTEKQQRQEKSERKEKKQPEKAAEVRQPSRNQAEKPAKQEKPERSEKREQPKKEFKKKERPNPKPVEAKPVETKIPDEKPVEKKEKKELVVDVEKVSRSAKEFLEQVFGAMGLHVSIETSFDAAEGELQVIMTGDDMGILIGKRGQTLDSLQYLVSLVVNKDTEGYLRVKLDTENYRERRKETLETLAKNISYKVKRTKHPVSLEPMNPYERRIIHSALQNDRYVITRSEGEDPYRHVVISLKREAYGENRRGRYGSRKDRYADKSADRTVEKAAEEAETEKSEE